MVTRIGTIVAAFGLCPSPGLAACASDALAVVASDGEILITDSGQMYHVLPGDDFTSQYWLPSEAIIVCDDDVLTFYGERRATYAIINRDENGEHVSALKGR